MSPPESVAIQENHKSVMHVVEKESVLESVINHSRYITKNFLGRGCWGKVFSGYDTLLDQEIAIKILDPIHLARKQMQYRQIDEFNAMKKEGGKLTASANIVPRRFEVDSNGKPFIVMPLYKKFFSDVLEEAFENKNARTVRSAFGFEKILDSGLTIDEIINYSRDLIGGIADVHRIFKKAHCDMKPDNIAVDDDSRLLISDMGTSTYASFVMTEAPRDNMGFLYTRSPRLFVEGEHPKKSADVFSFGSLLYKMFTGEYLLEKEIDEAMKAGGHSAVKKFMGQFYEKNCVHYDNIDKAVSKKLKDKDIPERFQDLIKRCVHENSQDGDRLKTEFEHAVTSYLESKIEKRAVNEFKSKLKKKALGGLITGTVSGAFLIGLLWLGYCSPKPNYSDKTDIATRVDTRELPKSGVTLQLDHAYNKEFDNSKLDDTYQNLLKHHISKSKNRTMVDRLITLWIRTADEMGSINPGSDDGAISVISPVDYESRCRYIEPHNYGGAGMIPNFYLNDYLKTLLTFSLATNQMADNVVDMEDALVSTYLGSDLHRAQKAANSFDFDNYLKAKDEKGKYVISQSRQEFLKRLVYNISVNKELSQNMRLK